jgi:hypothetical protein
MKSAILILEIILDFGLSKLSNIAGSAGFTYRLDMLKPMASKFRGTPAKMFAILTFSLDFHRLGK